MGSGKKQREYEQKMMQMTNAQLAAEREEREIQRGILEKQKEEYRAFEFQNPFADIQNPYAGLQRDFENVYEDLTVDMKAAEFQAEQGAQQRANIMQGLRGAAGTAGVAGLAQALAGQGTLQAQQISATIGQQEAANKRLAAQGAAQVQQMEAQRGQLIAQGGFQADVMRREGEVALQAAEFGRESTLLGMDYGLLAGANQAEQMALSNQMSAKGMEVDMWGSQAANNPWSQLLSAGATMAAGYFGGASGGAALTGLLGLGGKQ